MLNKKVYFSSLLTSRFPNVYKQLSDVLQKHNVQMGLLENTKDVWCRDYMPVTATDGSFIQFKFQPDYLKGYEHLLSDPRQVMKTHNVKPHYCEIIIDGGNIVRYGDKAIITDKVFSENPQYSKEKLIEEIKKLLQLSELIVIPKQPYEMTGHADGMVRFIDQNNVLLNDFSQESKSFNVQLENSLYEAGLEVKALVYPNDFYNGKRDWGAYLNYLKINDLVIVPTFGIPEDIQIMKVFKRIFSPYKLVHVVVPELIQEGGALNCISWEYTL